MTLAGFGVDDARGRGVPRSAPQPGQQTCSKVAAIATVVRMLTSQTRNWWWLP